MDVTAREHEPLDALDRRIVAALQLNGRAAWRDIAPVVDASETTVARRAQRILDAGLIRIAAVRDPHCAAAGHIANVLIRCRSGRHADVARALLRRPDVWALSIVTGAYDVVCQVTLPDADDLARVLLRDLPRIDGIESTSAETVLRTFKLSYDWARGLLGPDADRIAVPPVVHGEEAHRLSPVEEATLAALAGDARRPYSSVAEEIGVHEKTVRRRFEALRGRGCVNVATFVPGAVLGFQPEMLIRVDVAPPHLDTAAAKLAAHRGVRYLAVTLGQVGLFGEVFLPSLDAVYQFTTEVLGGLPGVLGAHISTQLLTLKRGYVAMPAAAALEHGAGAVLERPAGASG